MWYKLTHVWKERSDPMFSVGEILRLENGGSRLIGCVSKII